MSGSRHRAFPSPQKVPPDRAAPWLGHSHGTMKNVLEGKKREGGGHFSGPKGPQCLERRSKHGLGDHWAWEIEQGGGGGRPRVLGWGPGVPSTGWGAQEGRVLWGCTGLSEHITKSAEIEVGACLDVGGCTGRKRRPREAGWLFRSPIARSGLFC